MNLTRNLFAVKLEVGDFIRDCESLAVRMVQRIDADSALTEGNIIGIPPFMNMKPDNSSSIWRVDPPSRERPPVLFTYALIRYVPVARIGLRMVCT